MILLFVFTLCFGIQAASHLWSISQANYEELEVVDFHICSGTEVSLGAAIIAPTSLLTGLYFALPVTLPRKKVSTAGAALGLTTLETVKLFKVSQCQIFLRTLLLLARLGTHLAKLFPNLQNKTLSHHSCFPSTLATSSAPRWWRSRRPRAAVAGWGGGRGRGGRPLVQGDHDHDDPLVIGWLQFIVKSHCNVVTFAAICQLDKPQEHTAQGWKTFTIIAMINIRFLQLMISTSLSWTASPRLSGRRSSRRSEQHEQLRIHREVIDQVISFLLSRRCPVMTSSSHDEVKRRVE